MGMIESNSGRREVSVEPNIVPFIDLMSVLIIFLLITAVWTQVSIIQLGTSIYGQKSSEDTLTPLPQSDVPLKLFIKKNGFQLLLGARRIWIPKSGRNYNYKSLTEELKKFKKRYPRKKDAMVSSLDTIKYGFLIEGIDYLLDAGFPEVSVSTEELKGEQ